MSEYGSDIEIIDIAEEMERSFIDYAMSVIVGRALPDVRDGLKPVHRRILYSMDELGVRYNASYRKSARIIGDVMGKYHPHGDAAIYESMARLSQEFSTRYMLVDGQGNFGSVDGDQPAAMRYTEARLSRLASEMLRDIDKDTVEFVSNFDDSEQEPAVLPSRFPNLLVNGSSGIAVGMATSIPPHNMRETVDAAILLLKKPEANLSELMAHIKGPDFPTGGIIMGRNGIIDAYKTGRGRVVVRAKTEIEALGSNRHRIVITEIPYMVNKARLVEKIADLVRDKKITGISDINDFSDRNGMKIAIDLKRDANQQLVLNQLFKYTPLQDTFSINMLALVDGMPKVISLKEALESYLSFQKEIIAKRTKYDLDRALARSHILEGYIIALDNIDEVIAVIRASYDDAEERLMEAFSLSNEQAKAIVDMRLRRLQGLEREKIAQEHAELAEKIAYYNRLLDSEAMVVEVLESELLEIKNRYGDERRTSFEANEDDANFAIEDLITEEDVVVTITHRGYIKRVSSSAYKAQRRGGKGIMAHTTLENDFVRHIFFTTTLSQILFFSNKGRAYKMLAYYLPDAQRQAKGQAIVNILSLSPGEKITAVIPFKGTGEDSFLFMATRNGIIKRSKLSLYNTNRSLGFQAITLNEGDELIDVLVTDGKSNILLGTRNGSALLIDENQARPTGRSARGVRGVKLLDDDYVVGIGSSSEGGFALTATENGLGRLSSLDRYRLTGRGGKGVINYKPTARTGAICGICVLDPEKDDIMILAEDGKALRMEASQLRKLNRTSSGVRVIKLAENVRISAIAKVLSEASEDEDDGEE
ncbi:MAG: DNA gyrase subunit A [Eubacteriaceae bacterium]|nr:DNA gyrase subunit A [Eubacteriaceae bacterium]